MKTDRKRLLLGFIQVLAPLLLLSALEIVYSSITHERLPRGIYIILFLLTLLGALISLSYLWRTRN